MLSLALVFLVIAIVAAILNFSGNTLLSQSITQISFYLFLVLSIVTLAVGIARKPPKI